MVIWSINIMIGILLVAVGISIFWIFKYDDWYPNPVVDEHHSSRDDEQDAGMEIGAESYAH